MLQPTLGRCSLATGRLASTASSAARRSAPVTGFPLPGLLSSNWPRYTSLLSRSNKKKSGVHAAA
jgi:hypothetical protein